MASTEPRRSPRALTTSSAVGGCTPSNVQLSPASRRQAWRSRKVWIPRLSSCSAAGDSPIAEATESPMRVARTGPVGGLVPSLLSLLAVAALVVAGAGTGPTGGGGPRCSVAPVWLGSAARTGAPFPPLPPPPQPATTPALATTRTTNHLHGRRSTARHGTERCGRLAGGRGTEESNLALRFWRPPCYRYTSPPGAAAILGPEAGAGRYGEGAAFTPHARPIRREGCLPCASAPPSPPPATSPSTSVRPTPSSTCGARAWSA